MKNAIVSLVGGLVIWGLAEAAPPPPAAGKVLILDNDQLIEGDVRRVGDSYRVRRGAGETVIPARRVADLVADRAAAYEAMRSRLNLRDADERLRLIRWCLQNNFRAEAIAEGESLLKYRPEDDQLRALVAGLKRLPESASARQESSTVKPSDKVIEVEPPDYNPESFPAFASKVQPILMNTCASCHAAGKGGDFVVARVSDGGSRRAALLNLAAVLKHLDRRDPEGSPLLTKAVTAHGKATLPPIRDREAPAFQTLEAWVKLALAREGPAEPVAVNPPPFADKKSVPAAPKKESSLRFGETSTSRTKPEPQTEAKDPFDPAIFNGTIQPKK